MADMKRLECKITVRMPAEIDAKMRRAMRRKGVVKASDFVRQAVVRALSAQGQDDLQEDDATQGKGPASTSRPPRLCASA